MATRLESLCAAEMRRFVETAHELDPSGGAAHLDVAGGVAAYIAPGSPLSQAFGLGLHGPVGPDEIVALERFYTDRDTQPLLGACPLAHPSLFETLSGRGWTVAGFENVLFRMVTERDLSLGGSAPGIEIREVDCDDDRRRWVAIAATAFSAPLPVLDSQLEIGRIVVRRPGSRLFIVMVDGCDAGTGELYVEDGVAWLSADATLPAFRCRGVQQAIQRHRLALAAEAGCELAATEAAPGSPSQRNMERLDFRVAYTRVDLALVWPPRPAAD